MDKKKTKQELKHEADPFMTIPETENEQENSTEQEDNESLTQTNNETGKADSSLKKRK